MIIFKKRSMRALICFILFLIITNCFSQKGNANKGLSKHATELNTDSVVYANARANSDYSVMMVALYYMMVKNPQKSLSYKDSLTTIYYLIQAYPNCIRLGNEVLSLQPDNFRIRELVAISHRIMGNTKTALEMYEKLYSETNSPIHAYYIAEMQFNIQRYGECLATLENILSAENSKKERIELIINENSKQKVLLTAAALNIKGMMFAETGKNKEAKDAFISALSIEKDFILPKTNLERINQKSQTR